MRTLTGENRLFVVFAFFIAAAAGEMMVYQTEYKSMVVTVGEMMHNYR